MRGLSPVAASGGHSSSRCAGLSLSRPLLLRSTRSRRADSVAVAHGPSCSAACGIFPDQGSNPCPLHWQADPQPLRHQGSPLICYFWAGWSQFNSLVLVKALFISWSCLVFCFLLIISLCIFTLFSSIHFKDFWMVYKISGSRVSSSAVKCFLNGWFLCVYVYVCMCVCEWYGLKIAYFHSFGSRFSYLTLNFLLLLFFFTKFQKVPLHSFFSLRYQKQWFSHTVTLNYVQL